MNSRKIVGLVLIIVGLLFFFLPTFGISYFPGVIPYLIGLLCIISGIYLLIRKSKPLPEWRKDFHLVKKKSKIIFIVGTIIIAFSCIMIWISYFLIFLQKSWNWGFVALFIPFFSIIYFCGLIMILYSIYVSGNKRVWLYLPVVLIIIIIVIIHMIISNDSIYQTFRIVWFLAFPLSYIPPLILYIMVARKENDIEQ